MRRPVETFESLKINNLMILSNGFANHRTVWPVCDDDLDDVWDYVHEYNPEGSVYGPRIISRPGWSHSDIASASLKLRDYNANPGTYASFRDYMADVTGLARWRADRP